MSLIKPIIQPAPFKIQVVNETGEVEFETGADSYYIVSKYGNQLKTSSAPSDFVFQLGLLHFALNQVNRDQAGKR